MKNSKKIKIFAIGVLASLLTLAISSSATAHIDPPPSVSLCLRDRVEIFLEVFEFQDPMFEGHAIITCNTPDINVTVVHNLVYPNGDIEQLSWFQGTLNWNIGWQFWILCMYLTNEFGKYSWVTTVTEDATGLVLAEEKVTWEREPLTGIADL